MSVSESQEPDKPKVYIWKLARDSYGILFHNIGKLFGLAIIPMTAGILLGFAYLSTTGGSYLELGRAGTSEPWWWINTVVGSFLGAVFAVGWHRLILLGSADATGPVQFRVSRREVKFFLFVVLLMIPFYLGNLLIGLLTASPDGDAAGAIGGGLAAAAGSIVFIIVSTIIWVRCSFLFPAIAVEADQGLATAWRQTSGVAWRLFWAGMLVVIPLLIVVLVLFWPDGPVLRAIRSAGFGDYPNVVVQQAVGYISYAAMVGVVSLAYKRRTGWVSGERPVVERGR